MKKVFSKRNLIIMFFPVVFVLVILTLGIPQQLLPAVNIGGEKYTIVDYNFYYYEAYYNFANENYANLGELGLNLNASLKSQDYDENTTWAQHFREVTLADMQEYAILRHEAEAAGFDASQAVAEVHAEKEELIRTYCVMNNVNDPDQYLSQLYDAGMTEKIYYEQLDQRSLAGPTGPRCCRNSPPPIRRRRSMPSPTPARRTIRRRMWWWPISRRPRTG